MPSFILSGGSPACARSALARSKSCFSASMSYQPAGFSYGDTCCHELLGAISAACVAGGSAAANWREIEMSEAQNIGLAYVPDAPRRNCFASMRITSRIRVSTITPETLRIGHSLVTSRPCIGRQRCPTSVAVAVPTFWPLASSWDERSCRAVSQAPAGHDPAALNCYSGHGLAAGANQRRPKAAGYRSAREGFSLIRTALDEQMKAG